MTSRRDILKATLGGVAALLTGWLPKGAAAKSIARTSIPLTQSISLPVYRFQTRSFDWPGKPQEFIQLVGRVNAVPFGRFRPGQLMLTDIDTERSFREDGTVYHAVSWTFQFRDQPWGTAPDRDGDWRPIRDPGGKPVCDRADFALFLPLAAELFREPVWMTCESESVMVPAKFAV